MQTISFILGVVPPSTEGGSQTLQMNSPIGFILGVLISFIILEFMIQIINKHKKL